MAHQGNAIDLLAAVNQQRREAKEERARAMDGIVELLLERAEARALLTRWCTMAGGQRPGLEAQTVAFLERTDATGGEGDAQTQEAHV